MEKDEKEIKKAVDNIKRKSLEAEVNEQVATPVSESKGANGAKYKEGEKELKRISKKPAKTEIRKPVELESVPEMLDVARQEQKIDKEGEAEEAKPKYVAPSLVAEAEESQKETHETERQENIQPSEIKEEKKLVDVEQQPRGPGGFQDSRERFLEQSGLLPPKIAGSDTKERKERKKLFK